MAGVVSVKNSVDTGHEDMIVSLYHTTELVNLMHITARLTDGLLWEETGHLLI